VVPGGGGVKPERQRSAAALLAGMLMVLLGLLNLAAAIGFVGLGYYLLNVSQSDFEKWLTPEWLTFIKDHFGKNMADFMFKAALGSFGLGLITALLAFPVLFAGTGMMRGRGYPGAVFGALVAFIAPGGFLLLGTLVGLIAVIVLLVPSVRQSFGRVESDQPERPKSGARILPGILLIVVGVLTLLFGISYVGASYFFLLYPADNLEKMLTEQSPDGMKWVREHPEVFASISDFLLKEAIGLFVLGLVTFVLGLPVLFGGINMLRARGYFTAVFGSLVCFIAPGGCGILGPVIGLYAFIVLMLSSVRQSFR
jgi:hypothetical protein